MTQFCSSKHFDLEKGEMTSSPPYSLPTGSGTWREADLSDALVGITSWGTSRSGSGPTMLAVGLLQFMFALPVYLADQHPLSLYMERLDVKVVGSLKCHGTHLKTQVCPKKAALPSSGQDPAPCGGKLV